MVCLLGESLSHFTTSMKSSKSVVTLACLGILATPFPSMAQKLESGTAGATTTPQYAKKVAQTYCDFLKAEIDPHTALRQAETEVRNSAARPSPFNQDVYNKTLQKAVTEKGFCPAMPDIEKIVLEPQSCSLSPRDINTLFYSKHIQKEVGNCFISISAH